MNLSKIWFPVLFLCLLAVALAPYPAPVFAQEESLAESASTETSAETEAPNGDENDHLIQKKIDAFFAKLVNNYMAPVMFRQVPVPGYVPSEAIEGGPEEPQQGIPVIVLTLALGGIFFTFRYGFINIRLFKHAIYVVRGHFDDEHDKGEITHFQALSSALAATVGLGNIAGVAIAITVGGPGAVFWMWLTAIFGMSLKFSCCTLAQLYRRIDNDGHVLGGPMVYLYEGLKDTRIFGISLYPLGVVFSPLFAVLTIGAAFGGGNMFQSNQTHRIAAQVLGFEGQNWFAVLTGLILAFLVAVVVVGGIKRIGEVTSKLVPGMCVGYCLICLILIIANITQVPELIAGIFGNAFTHDAMYGGFLGVLVQGLKRAAFSNEAGIGSAAIAHAAAKTDEPIREGVVAMLGPFIDTIVVCTMTALAILITNSHLDAQGMEGIRVTSRAFESLHPALDYFLLLAVFVFAYSTMIGWGYYGERATEWLARGNMGAIWAYRFVYVFVAAIAPILSLSSVVDFADMMLLSMAFPNIIGMVFLSGKVKVLLADYLRRLNSGEMHPDR